MGYPLAALAIRPPAPAPDMMEQYARAINLKNMMQLQPLQMQAAQQEIATRGIQNQVAQAQLAQTQMFNKAFGIGTEPSAAPAAAPSAAGAAPTAAGAPSLDDMITKASQAGPLGIDLMNKLTEVQKNRAALQESADKHREAVNDLFGLASSAAQDSLKTPGVDPHAVMQSLFGEMERIDPARASIIESQLTANPQSLNQVLSSLAGNSKTVAGFQNQQLVAQIRARGKEDLANWVSDLNSSDPAAVAAAKQKIAKWTKANADTDEAKALASVAPPVVQAKVAEAGQVAASGERGRMGVEYGEAGTALKLRQQQALAGGANAAVASVAPHLVPTAIADATKAGQQYASAQQAADDMKTFIDSARAGNKVAYAYSPVEGVLTLNTGRGVKRVNMSEISAYGGAGSAFDRVSAFLGKQTSGASLPADILNDMAGLHQGVTDNARNAYSNNLQVINQNYGSNFQPVDLGRGGARTAGPPAGAVGKAPGSDGKMHYHDQRGNDLGVVGGQ